MLFVTKSIMGEFLASKLETQMCKVPRGIADDHLKRLHPQSTVTLSKQRPRDSADVLLKPIGALERRLNQ